MNAQPVLIQLTGVNESVMDDDSLGRRKGRGVEDCVVWRNRKEKRENLKVLKQNENIQWEKKKEQILSSQGLAI